MSTKGASHCLISLEDREDIRTLIARYNHACDEGLVDEWANLFTDDGEFYSTVAGSAKGHAELRAWLEHELSLFEGYRIAHYVTNTLFLPQTANLVRVRSSCLMTRTSLTGQVAGDVKASIGAELVGMAVYEDLIERTDQGWKFKHRHGDMMPDFDPAYLQD